MKEKLDYLQHYVNWANAEIEQGKWMVGVALVVLIPFLTIILKSSNVLLRGMTIPITLLLAVSLCYGGYLLINRPKSVEVTKMRYQMHPDETHKSEYQKGKSASNDFVILKKIWVVSIIIFCVSYLLVDTEYYKGLLLGFILLFAGLLFIDTFLHNRLIRYLLDIHI